MLLFNTRIINAIRYITMKSGKKDGTGSSAKAETVPTF
jgi:hypothetical protein